MDFALHPCATRAHGSRCHNTPVVSKGGAKLTTTTRASTEPDCAQHAGGGGDAEDLRCLTRSGAPHAPQSQRLRDNSAKGHCRVNGYEASSCACLEPASTHTHIQMRTKLHTIRTHLSTSPEHKDPPLEAHTSGGPVGRLAFSGRSPLAWQCAESWRNLGGLRLRPKLTLCDGRA